MNNDTTATVGQKSFPERRCAYPPCQGLFTPKIGKQRYCRGSHRVLDYQQNRFNQAVDAEVEKRLHAMGVGGAH